MARGLHILSFMAKWFEFVVTFVKIIIIPNLYKKYPEIKLKKYLISIMCTIT